MKLEDRPMFCRVLGEMSQCYPGVVLSEGTMQQYFTLLGSLSLAAFRKGAVEAMKESPSFFPPAPLILTKGESVRMAEAIRENTVVPLESIKAIGSGSEERIPVVHEPRHETLSRIERNKEQIAIAQTKSKRDLHQMSIDMSHMKLSCGAAISGTKDTGSKGLALITRLLDDSPMMKGMQ